MPLPTSPGTEDEGSSISGTVMIDDAEDDAVLLGTRLVLQI
ncbi:MAG: hypothetical protein ACRYG8_22260 [Janthinobacterium lividum]